MDETKVRFLFWKVQHTGLSSSIVALKVSKTTGTTISYTMAANHLSIATSDFLEYITNNEINVLGVQVGNGSKAGDDIYNEDGSTNNGHIPSWKYLPFKDRKLVIDERKRLGIRCKGESGSKSGRRGNSNHKTADPNCFKQLKEQN